MSPVSVRIIRGEGMIENKYFWLKLKEDFFNDPDIKLIKSQKDGKDYIILYLQLQLLSLRTEGLLRHKDIIPYTPDMLSSLTDTPVGVVKQAIELFIALGMIEQWDDGTLYMSEMQKLIGKESESAERVRRHREKQLALQCNNDVIKSNTEIEIDLEKEKEINNTPKISRNVSNLKEVFEHYMTLDLVNHRSYTKDMQRAIEIALKNNHYDIDYCKTLLDRHKAVVEMTKHTEFPVKARSLYEFFGQKVYGCKNLICTEYEEGGKLFEKYLKDVKSKVDISDFEVVYQDG